MKKSDRVLIEVTELRAISADRYQWMVMKRTKKKDRKTGEPMGGYSTWDFYSSHNTLEDCAKFIEHEQISTCGATTFPELRRAADHIHKLMLETIEKGKIK